MIVQEAIDLLLLVEDKSMPLVFGEDYTEAEIIEDQSPYQVSIQ